MIEIRQIKNKEEWEKFLSKQKFCPMTQSTKYGVFYEQMNEESFILGLYENENLVFGSLILSIHARRGNFLFLPYGPIGEQKKEYIELFFTELKKIAEQKKYSFLRISPFIENTKENREVYENFGFKLAPIHILAETTWLLDLENSEEDTLKQMNKNHRNLIKRCEKEGVKIEITNNIEELKDFNNLHDFTAKKHNFTRFSNDYIKKEFQNFLPNEVLLFKAFLPDGKLDAAAVIYFYKNMAAYRHGASLNLNNKIPSSYLLQWTAIKEAKKRGIKYYNFWGIAPDNAKDNHPFKGITHFKKGFGGFKLDLLPCHDLMISKKYFINLIIEKIRAKKRGF
ncbi:MAG: peptidoglycan bridge formation glycyltransferase FemA/FemB family protein [Patescibacteria group bacterium]